MTPISGLRRMRRRLASPWRRSWAIYVLIVAVPLLWLTREFWAAGRLAELWRKPSVVSVPEILTPRARRPATAPNGQPWPTTSAYIAGFPKLNIGGRASVSADNHGNASDAFVKLVSLDGAKPRVVRVFFVRGEEQFTVNKVKPGRYELLYELLSTGEKYRSVAFEVTVKKSADGETYMGWTIGLYGVIDGTSHRDRIFRKDFERHDAPAASE